MMSISPNQRGGFGQKNKSIDNSSSDALRGYQTIGRRLVMAGVVTEQDCTSAAELEVPADTS